MRKIPRFNEHLTNPRPNVRTQSFDCVEYFLVNDKAEFEGKVLNKSHIKALRSSDNFNGLTCSQFSIENKIELGVNPTPVSIIGDNFSMMDDIQNAVNRIDELKSQKL